ncbi:unnamed protein product [Calicophoron daubneyi]|uniref:FERM domain-containing protein n=1 Tax=Calicophoron daubneyi TaxID=300641 RepID=A0AAV2TW83_CALDB
MAAIVRFFSKRFRRKKSDPRHSYAEEVFGSNREVKTKKSDLECRVFYLDESEKTFYLPKKSKASELCDIAFASIGLNEDKDYFGLKYNGKLPIWLDPTKEIRKQCKADSPYSIYFRVKFFASDPRNLHDECARYLVVLQLREDIHTGRLRCEDRQLAAELAALLLQGEFGDFDPGQHTLAFVSTFRFLPDEQQTPDFEMSVLMGYKALRNQNLTPADADLLYLEKARLIPDYGVDIHTVQAKNKQECRLGLTPTGILVYEDDKKIGLFYWPNILKIEMKGRRLMILVADEDEATRKVIEHSFCFVLPNNVACKNLWKSAVEYHTFFRLTDRNQPPPKHRRLFRLRSRFTASFHTEYQLHNLNLFGSSSFRKRKGGSVRSAPSTPTQGRANEALPTKSASFRRAASKRFSPRPNFAQYQNRSDRSNIRGTTNGTSETSGSSHGGRTVATVEVPSADGGLQRVVTRQPIRPPPVDFGAHKPLSSEQPAVRVTPLLPGFDKRPPASPSKPAPTLLPYMNNFNGIGSNANQRKKQLLEDTV